MPQNLKELKKIAEACRKAGITSYKCADFEITLSPADPKPTRAKRGKTAVALDEVEQTDELSFEDKLFWSSANPDERLES